MRYSSALLEDIQARIPISVLVGQKVKLRRAGKSWQGLCPLHSEKTPSFTCDDTRGTYHCFGCSEGGDHFSFLMKTRGLTFPEAVQELANEAGIQLPKSSPDAIKAEARRLGILEITEAACRYFEGQFKASPQAHAYAQSRGIGQEACHAFRIGYAGSDRYGLKRFLGSQGVSNEAAIEAGVLAKSDTDSFDRFWDRLIFPILNEKRIPLGFGGRDLSGQSQAKYLNGTESPVFHKSAVLYNGPSAREAAHQGHAPILTEGYLDVISCVQAGFLATVAPMGTAVTEDQILKLWQMSDEPIAVLDGDSAGEKAMDRLALAALPLLTPGRTIRFARLPKGQDPDDIIRSGGAAAFRQALKSPQSLAQAVWDWGARGMALDTPERLSGQRRRIAEVLASVKDDGLRKLFLKDLDDRIKNLGVRPRVYRSNGHSLHSTSPGSIRLVNGYRSNGLSLRESMIIGSLASFPGAAMNLAEEVDRASLSPQAHEAAKKIIEAFVGLSALDPVSRNDALTATGLGPMIEAAISACTGAGIALPGDDGAAQEALAGALH